MKTMDNRDKARSDLYLAQLRLQSAPNTPGFAGFSYPPKSPFFAVDPHSAAEKGESCMTQYASPRSPTRPTPSFQLQPPPIRIQQPTPCTAQEEFQSPVPTSTPIPPASQSPSPPPLAETESQHISAAPGEQNYAAVPIPGAYTGVTPAFPPAVYK